MKKYFLTLILISGITILVNARTDETWFGLLKLADGFTDEIIIHVKESNAAKLLVIDFPLKSNSAIMSHDPFSIEVKNAQIDKNYISFTLPDDQIHFDGKVNFPRDQLSARLVISGKPFDILFTKVEDKSFVSRNPDSIETIPGISNQAMSPDKEMKRLVEKSNSLFTEELTWIEIRDAIREGKTTIIIATGGVEQNGAYLATGKHNYVLRGVVDSIAHKLGNALIAPIIPFVPEGNHSPTTGHMKYPGTISVKEDTYENLLKDISNSYKANGFKKIVFIGDSGGNQWGMFMVAKELNANWQNENCKALYIHEYYDNYRVSKWLNAQGIKEVDTGVHDSFQYTSQIMALDPSHVRMNQRVKAGDFSINGVNLLPFDKTIELGKRLCNYQADVTVEAIKKALLVE
jgi:creatinine amidohydrolase/Fe(II)-dependent formamide hydrolase-like protein